MTLAADIAGDFAAVLDGLEAVTLTNRGGSAQSISHALRKALGQREAAASNGEYLASDLVWHFPISEATTAPAIGAAITDADGVTWTVLETTKYVVAGVYRCVSRVLSIVADSQTLVTIQHASWAKGTAGALEPTWSDQYTAVRAQIQPLKGERVVSEGQVGMTADTAVYFAAQYNLTPSHRIIGPAGDVYRVLSWEQSDRIDALYMATCQKTGDVVSSSSSSSSA